MNGFDVEMTTSNTGFGGKRIWFKCPMCQKRIGIVYQHPINSQIGCRSCLNIDYRKRMHKGMVEDIRIKSV